MLMNTRIRRIQTVPYQKVSSIYDEIMQHVEYDHWARYIEKIIESHLKLPVRLLDVGCGTGQFIYEIKKLGFAANGCDPSMAMLKMARKKNPGTYFWIDRLPELKLVRPAAFAVITCLYDTINYLPSLPIILDALKRVYSLLPTGGLFIFDVVSDNLCQNCFRDDIENEVIDSKYAYQRRSFFNAESHQQITEFTVYTSRGIFEERHIQYIYSFADIAHLIRNKTAFDLRAVYQDFTFFEVNEGSERAHFVLKKNQNL